MKKASQKQKGAQRHAEGGHGPKTRAANIEQLRSGRPEENASPQATGAPREGKHRIRENRQQHDEADKNSEKNRLRREEARAGEDEPTAT